MSPHMSHRTLIINAVSAKAGGGLNDLVHTLPLLEKQLSGNGWRVLTYVVGAGADALRRAGARELFVVVNLSDLPGIPFVVVPLNEGADAAAIGRLFCGGGNEPLPIAFPTCATVHNAVMARVLEDVLALVPSATGAAIELAPSPAGPSTLAWAVGSLASDDGDAGARVRVPLSAQSNTVFALASVRLMQPFEPGRPNTLRQ